MIPSLIFAEYYIRFYLLGICMFDLNLNKTPKIAYKELRSDSFTPKVILSNFHVEALLESAYINALKGRYSIMILKSAFKIFKLNDIYLFSSPSTKINLNEINKDRKYLDWIDYFRELSPSSNLNFPLPLGGIGYLGYEFCKEIEEFKNINFSSKKSINVPTCSFIFGRDFLIFDHLYNKALICSISYSFDISDFDLNKRIKSIESNLDNLNFNLKESNCNDLKILNPINQSSLNSSISYIKNEIQNLNIINCSLVNILEASSSISPKNAYSILRNENPSPYMFYFDFEYFAFFGASHEMILKLHGDELFSRPILEFSKKQKEEALLKNKNLTNYLHISLVDRFLNDLGKIAKELKVEESYIEEYAKSMHIASNINGKIKSKNALHSIFPPICGVSKINALHLIDSIESNLREFCGGVIVYIDRDGNFDSATTSSCIAYKNEKYYLYASLNISLDSINENEILQDNMNILLHCLEG